MAMAERDWKVAADLPARLVELREALGDSIPEFTRRFCRTRKQWYQWKEGTQLPGPTLLKTTAENYEWPLEIFTEGGRRPGELVNSPVNGFASAEPSGGPQGRRSPLTTATALDQAILELDRARARMVELRSTLGITSAGPGETGWIGAARAAGAGSDSPPQGEAPPGSETG